MSNGQLTLEEWIEQISGKMAPKKKELLPLFKRDWYEGHGRNPLLFPLKWDAYSWKDQFEWFVQVETFVVPKKKRPQAASLESKMWEGLKEVPEKVELDMTDLKAPAEKEAAEEAPTVIREAPPEAPAEKEAIEEAATVIMEAPPEVPAEKEAIEEAATVIMEAPPEAPAEKEAIEEAATVIMEAPPEAPAEKEAIEEAATVIMEVTPTVIMKTRTEFIREPQSSSEPQKEEKPKEVPEELELDMDDLETMKWDKEK